MFRNLNPNHGSQQENIYDANVIKRTGIDKKRQNSQCCHCLPYMKEEEIGNKAKWKNALVEVARDLAERAVSLVTQEFRALFRAISGPHTNTLPLDITTTRRPFNTLIQAVLSQGGPAGGIFSFLIYIENSLICSFSQFLVSFVIFPALGAPLNTPLIRGQNQNLALFSFVFLC